jgi:hypothetical protein
MTAIELIAGVLLERFERRVSSIEVCLEFLG